MTAIEFNTKILNERPSLKSFALSLTRNSEDAMDLIQETYVKAITYRSKFEDSTNLRAWLFTIMKNTFINDYRRNVKTKNTFDGSNNDFHLLVSTDKVYPGPDSFYSSKEINKTIDSLEDEYKVPFTMFLDGYKYKEIAEELDLPLGTVKSRIFFTRKKLEKALKDYSNN